MKRSSILLGATAAVLTMAGIAAKSHRSAAFPQFYYDVLNNPTGADCKVCSIQYAYTRNGDPAIRLSCAYKGIPYLAYTDGPWAAGFGGCTVPTYFNPL